MNSSIGGFGLGLISRICRLGLITAVELAGVAVGAFQPSYKFNDARNSQYIPMVF